MGWPALPAAEIQRRVHAALDANVTYSAGSILGLPGTALDEEVFPPLPELRARAWLRACMDNPNHIGCHTLGTSEGAFAGTQALEREVLELCGVDLMRAAPGTLDGYVASGGTESNVQAAWAFRNRWTREEGLEAHEIGLLCSVDTHYSAHKAANLLGLALETVAVDFWSRAAEPEDVTRAVEALLSRGVRAVIVILNLGTTMFGSIDDVDVMLAPLEARGIPYRAHVDAAFGGFMVPLVTDNPLDFRDGRIASLTMDAHKLLQAPYGTGIHLIRRGFLEHTTTARASYVRGFDSTFVGSRSGANAVAVWMILMTYGMEGGRRACETLLDRTSRLCRALDEAGLPYVRNPYLNVVALRDADVPREIAERYMLVPDRHDSPTFRKIVVMKHVTDEVVDAFLRDLFA